MNLFQVIIGSTALVLVSSAAAEGTAPERGDIVGRLAGAELGCKAGHAVSCELARLLELELTVHDLQQELRTSGSDRAREAASQARARILEMSSAVQKEPARWPGLTATSCRREGVALLVPPLL